MKNSKLSEEEEMLQLQKDLLDANKKIKEMEKLLDEKEKECEYLRNLPEEEK